MACGVFRVASRGAAARAAAAASNGRIRLLRVAFLVFLVLIGGRAVALATSPGNLTRIALEQQTRDITLPAHRGAILDANGQPLAVGRQQQTVYATPYLLKDPATATKELCAALQIHKKRERRALLTALSDKKSGFAYVARQADPQLAQAALHLDLPGRGRLHGGGAHLPHERLGPAGHRHDQHRQHGHRRPGARVQQAAQRPARQRGRGA